MRLLYVADGRSPIALNWIHYFIDQGHEVHLASTFPCGMDTRLASIDFVSVALSGLKAGLFNRGYPTHKTSNIKEGLWGASRLQLRNAIRHWLGPFTLPSAARHLDEIITRIQPDLIHAMRLPYEGMLASLTQTSEPLLVSVWGNDFTLHAPSTPWMRHYTRLALQRADALHTDCQRDQRLAQTWGFSKDKPAVVLPGAGGVQPEIFFPPSILDVSSENELDNEIPSQETPDTSYCINLSNESGEQLIARNLTVINPRGFRVYIRNDTFFRAIPLVLRQKPQTRFLCPAMSNEPKAWRWLDELGIAASVDLLPAQTRQQMAELFRHWRVMVSAATHDGTPNTLLEAMACGCLPIAGDIESIREWIIPGGNGLLINPGDAQDLAKAILFALEDEELHRYSAIHNTQLIAERACYPIVMAQAERFYESILQGR